MVGSSPPQSWTSLWYAVSSCSFVATWCILTWVRRPQHNYGFLALGRNLLLQEHSFHGYLKLANCHAGEANHIAVLYSVCHSPVSLFSPSFLFSFCKNMSFPEPSQLFSDVSRLTHNLFIYTFPKAGWSKPTRAYRSPGLHAHCELCAQSFFSSCTGPEWKAGKFSAIGRGNLCIIGSMCAVPIDFLSYLQIMRTGAKLRTVDIVGEDFSYFRWHTFPTVYYSSKRQFYTCRRMAYGE